MANPIENDFAQATDPSHGITGPGLAILLFLAFVVLIVISQGAAISMTMLRGTAVADAQVETALQQGQAVQKALEDARFRQLELISGLFAADPYFASYVAEAQQSALDFGGNVDTASVTDLLQERQEALGFDFSLVLDDRGDVIARTDRPVGQPVSLANDPVAGPVIETMTPATGYWQREGKVYQVSVVPLANGYELAGFLVTGMQVGDDVAAQIAATSGADIVFLAGSAEGGWLASASTLAAEDNAELLSQLPDSPDVDLEHDLLIAGHEWRPAVRTLGDSGAFVITLTDHAAALAAYRSIQDVLWLSMIVALMVAVLAGAIMARLIALPIRQLADATIHAAAGDYRHPVPTSQRAGRELRRLSHAFRSLLGDLREKSEMEQFLAEMARLQPEQGELEGVAAEAASIESGFMIGLKWKSGPNDQASEQYLRQAERILDVAIRAVAPLRGRLLGSAGVEATLLLPVNDATSAVTIAGNILQRCGQHDSLAAAIVPATAICGEVIPAGHRLRTWSAATAAALQQLVMDAVPGKIFLVRSIGKALADSGKSVSPAEGRLTGRTFYAVDAATATTFTVQDDDQTMAMTEVGALPVESAGGQGLRAGMVFGNRFAILSELGRGGMGAVFKALDRELNETVALKVLLGGQSFSRAELDAMKSEIRLARRISHPNILRTHDFGIIESTPYISMEYVRGLTLKAVLKQSGQLPPSAALRIARQVCAGLVAAHSQGVLHRDIKPENIIIEPNANSKLMDFGIALVARDEDSQAQPMGTPRYAAPEQMLAEPLDESVDIYALGIVLYEMFTGRLPFTASSIDKLIALKQQGGSIEMFDEYPDVPVPVRQLIIACIAGSRRERPRTSRELASRLGQLES